MYKIDVDQPRGLVTVALYGLMSLDETAAYIADVRRAFVVNGLIRYAMVIDITGCAIQSQEVIRALGAHIASMPKAHSLAIVTGSSLARMQVRRLFTQPYARIAVTVAEGRAWVLHGTEPAVERSVA